MRIQFKVSWGEHPFVESGYCEFEYDWKDQFLPQQDHSIAIKEYVPSSCKKAHLIIKDAKEVCLFEYLEAHWKIQHIHWQHCDEKQCVILYVTDGE